MAGSVRSPVGNLPDPDRHNVYRELGKETHLDSACSKWIDRILFHNLFLLHPWQDQYYFSPGNGCCHRDLW